MNNAANRKDIRKAEKADKLFEINDREAVTSIMSTLPGRSWMFRRLEACHCFNDPFTGDALHEAYRKGERNFGLQLLAQIMAYCPEQYIQMTREANDRYNSDHRDASTSPATEQPGGEDGNGGVEASELDNPTGTSAGLAEAGWNLVEGQRI